MTPVLLIRLYLGHHDITFNSFRNLSLGYLRPLIWMEHDLSLEITKNGIWYLGDHDRNSTVSFPWHEGILR